MPHVEDGKILIQTTRSLVSIGTEKMILIFRKFNLINKAIQQPDKFKEVINKVKSNGFISTYNTVLNKLDQPIPLGYL
jgi:hypothetical protein